MNGLPGWAALPESPELSMRRPTKFPEFPSPENSPGSLEDSGGGPKSAWNPEPVGRAFAMVAKRSDGNSLASECVKSKDGDEEIIKVYLKARADHEEPVTQLKSEVRHIQEAGSALKKLREDLSTKLQTRTEFLEFREFREFQESSEVVLEKRNQSCSCRGNSQDNPEDPEAPRLLWRLQEVEKRHQLERSGLERALLRCQEDAERADSARSRAETEVEQLQRLLAGMEKDHRDLLARMESGQAELERLRKAEGERAAQQERSSQLEKEVAGLREKIHHLDDMLKSQQRKVRQMIEQLQNSKSVIQAKDAAIQELKERVSYLEAENLEMHDRIEHLIEKQVSRGGSSARARSKSEYVSSKRLPGPKPLPLIRVVET
ncbi:tuftelin [Geospiza fortis]|uniref:Tuftelin n=1 Tax=Geospiza fortis TaxID=48883 RepID=A0A8N5F1Z3_GEOFO|nr:tuftelin [Geospiza fortis]